MLPKITDPISVPIEFGISGYLFNCWCLKWTLDGEIKILYRFLSATIDPENCQVSVLYIFILQESDKES